MLLIWHAFRIVVSIAVTVTANSGQQQVCQLVLNRAFRETGGR
jgi:hypothetical protein